MTPQTGRPAFTLDHLVIAVRDLEAAAADYQRLLGRAPSWRGEHPTYGTRNVLFRLENCYLELLALADQGEAGARPWQQALREHLDRKGEGLYAIALGTDDLDAAVAGARARGLEVLDPAEGEGIDLATGARRQWRNARVATGSTRGVVVFFIQHRSPPDTLPPAPPVIPDRACATAVDHLVVASSDLAACLRLWHERLGLELRLSRDFPGGRRIHFLRLGDAILELAGRAESGPWDEGDVLWGIALRVGDLERTVERMRVEGVEISDARPGVAPATRVADLPVPPRPAGGRQAGLRPGFSHDVRVLFIQKDVQEQAMVKVKRLDHLILAVQELERAARTWADTVGLGAEPPYQPEGSHLQLARLPLGDADDAFVELAQPTTEDHRVARHLAERGEGMFSISVEVDDLDAAVRELRSKGVTVSDPEAGVWPGTRLARIRRTAAHGVAIQLIERKR